jgi:acyl-CoA thioesterase-1
METDLEFQVSKKAATAPLKLTFFGDSICVGQGVSIFRGWVTRIAEALERQARIYGRSIIVSNSSVNGRTTRQALEDMPYQVQNHQPDILVIQFGLNDCNYWQTDRGTPRVSRNAFIANLEEIIDRGLNCGARYLLLNNNHPTSRTQEIIPFANIAYEDSNRAYNEAVRIVAARANAQVIFQDVEAFFLKFLSQSEKSMDSYLLDDGLHLNSAGHEIYFDLMRPVILDVVARCIGP